MFPTGTSPSTGGSDFVGKIPQCSYADAVSFGTPASNATFSLLSIVGKGIVAAISLSVVGTGATAFGVELLVDDTNQLNLYIDEGTTAGFVTYMSPNTKGFENSAAAFGVPLFICNAPIPFKKSIDIRVRNISNISASGTGYFNIHYFIG